MRREFIFGSIVATLALWAWSQVHQPALWGFVILVPIILLGIRDMTQSRQTIRRNFPVIGNFRYLFELIRPEINQYFIENNNDGVPFSREQRSLVYQRAKKALDTLPFGTQKNVYQIGYEWVNHSLVSQAVNAETLRVTIGGPQCKKPYSCSIFNISAMSYGALSKNAIRSLNAGAKIGHFIHDTGEGGVSPYHLENGGDLVWEVGTGYFSCRTEDGRFSPEKFKSVVANNSSIKMIALKLSQGAKPSHGGILPAAKVNEEVARIRGIPIGKDCISPPSHTAFSTPVGMMEFLGKLREYSGGLPVGFKLCIGKRREFIALCKAMLKTGVVPDFITIDGGEGGTGAAPLEFSNSIGCPLTEGLIFAHNCLTGFNLRKSIKIMCSGKVVSGMDVVSKLAIGADICNSARGMMMAIGCIQALRCNTNACPTGVATQDPHLVNGLVVKDKTLRVANYHRETVHSVADIIGAMGLKHTADLQPWHIMKRTGLAEVKHYGELYQFIKTGDLLKEPYPKDFERAVKSATAESFYHVDDLGKVVHA